MTKHRVPNIVRGGVALPLDKTNYYLVRGRKHEQGGIDIGKNPRTGLEVEDGEVVHVGDKELRVFSAEPILGGVSPSQLVVRGVNPDKVFAAQEKFKQVNGIKDDGTKAPFGTLKKLIFGVDFNDIKTSDGRNYNPAYIERAYSSLKKSNLTKKQQAVVLANIIEESGGDPFALNKNSGKDYGTLQWVDRYPKSNETDPYKEIDNQMGYFLNTVNNLDDKVSWTHGGKGSGYQSRTDAYNDFNSEDIETINRGFVLGHVRPAGKHASVKNRIGVAEQIYDRIKRFGGENKNKDSIITDIIQAGKAKIMDIAQANQNFESVSPKIHKDLNFDDVRNDTYEDVAQRTYLFNRKNQEKAFLNSGYIKGEDKDYGLVKKAVGNRNLPVYQKNKDVINRSELEVIGNLYTYDDPSDKSLYHAGSYPVAIYKDKNNKLYFKGWDLHDYGLSSAGSGGAKYDKFRQIGANLLDKLGNPSVITTGYQNISDIDNLLLIANREDKELYKKLVNLVKGENGLSEENDKRFKKLYDSFLSGHVVNHVSKESIDKMRKTKDNSHFKDEIPYESFIKNINKYYTNEELEDYGIVLNKKRLGGNKPYTTKLNPKEEFEFRQWYKKLADKKGLNPDYDAEEHYYDYRGFWKNEDRYGILNDNSDVHFTDRYKKPGHPTFSNESIYSKGNTIGGNWVQDKNGNWLFNHSDYTKQYKDKTKEYLRGSGEGYIIDGDTITDKKQFGGNMKHKLVEVNIGGNSKLIRVVKPSSTGESERSEGLTRKRAAIGIKTRKLEDDTVVPVYANILAENSTLENPIINPEFKKQEKATNRIEAIKGFIEPNSNLISDVIGVGSNIIGSLITKRINNKALDSLTFQKPPVALMPSKLKTKININPQLDKMRESLADYERLISGNTASSRVALGRINRVRNQGIANTNQLYGQKENMETQLINQDAINQQKVLDRNLQQDYQYRAAKNAFENEVRNLKAENKVANVQNIVTGIQDLLTRREQRKMFNKTLTAETLANPNLPAEMYLKSGIWSKELYNMYRSQYPLKQ